MKDKMILSEWLIISFEKVLMIYHLNFNESFKSDNESINLQSLFLLLGVRWSVKFLSADFAIVFFKPLEGVSWIVIVNHALNFGWVIVEVAESSAHVISLNVVEVNIVTNACCKQSEEFSNVLWVGVYECIWSQQTELS